MATGAFSSISKTKRNIISIVTVCKYCNSDKDLVIDHIFPPSRGGNSDLENLTRCCVSCNSMKSCMTIPEWKLVVEEKIYKYGQLLDRYKNILGSIESESYKMGINAE